MDAITTTRKESIGVYWPFRQAAGEASSQQLLSSNTSEAVGALRHPISRWYLCPVAEYVANLFVASPVRPNHITILGFALAVMAAATLIFFPSATIVAACFVLAYWFCDRTDGPLARRQHTVSARGAWLDANIDEVVDLGLHLAVTIVVAKGVGADWPWMLFVAWIIGKYLLMYGLWTEERFSTSDASMVADASQQGRAKSILRRIYHLPGNADVRIHMLILALATGWLAVELIGIAIYYNARWLLRWGLVTRRLAD